MQRRNSQKGQTSVEYILLVGVMIFISIGVFKQIREYVVTNPDSMVNRYLSSFDQQFGGGGGRFKYFSLKK